MPVARWRGTLNIVGMEVPCYVLDNGARVIGRTSATEVLSGIKGGGALEIYLGAKALEPFINKDLVLERFVPFRLQEVEGLKKAVKGLPAELFIEICQGFVAGLQASFDPKSPYPRLTDRQRQMAIQASMFLSACAKLGLEALIDEATGYQYERADDALQVGTSTMTKSLLKKALRSGSRDKYQGVAIKDTLKALENLKKAGVVGGGGYTLTSPYSKKPIGGATNRKMPKRFVVIR